LEGEGRGAKGKAAREKQAFDDASRMLREKKSAYLQPFFDEAERRHPGPTTNLDKRAKELKVKILEVMREQLKPLMGDSYVDQLVEKVTLGQIKECYQIARQKEEEEDEKKRERQRKEDKKTRLQKREEEYAKIVARDAERTAMRDAEQKARKQKKAALKVDARQREEYYKKKIEDGDSEFLDPIMWYGFERVPAQEKSFDAMLEQVRKRIKETVVGLSEASAEQVAKTLTMEQLRKWVRENKTQAEKRRKELNERKRASISVDSAIESAYETARGSLNATLKRARLLTDKKITIEDVKKWRLENANVEKRTNRKFYNSWVGNKAKEEYQVDLFYFMDLKKKQALKELQEERAKDDEEAARMEANNVPAPDAIAALPPEQNPPPKRKELLRKINELSWEYESGLLVVDTFSKKLAVEPMKNRDWLTIQRALERAFSRLGGKPGSIYSDAEAAMTSKLAQDWFRQQGIRHNITLSHAPVAERMIGVIKTKIVDALGEPRHTWWQEVDKVVDEYNEEHISRSTKMTPDEAHRPDNRVKVKTNLEAIRKMNNPQPTINVGDEVRVMMKKKFDKSYVPDWSDKTYKVKVKKEGNYTYYEDVPKDPQRMYKLEAPPYSLFKDRFMRHELLRVK